MRPLLLAAATAAGFAVLPAPGALAQTACLYGGPDPAADLACGRAFVAQPAASGRAQGAPAPRAQAVARSNGVAESRILSSGAPYAPAAPALPYGYEYEPRPDPAWAAPPPYAPQSYEPLAGPAYGHDAGAHGAYGYAPDPYGQAYAPPYGPETAYGAGGYAYGPYDQGGYAYGPGPQYGPDQAYSYGPSHDYAPPPAPPGLDFHAPAYMHVEGAGHAAPGTYAYAYQSADGEAYAWRYETPEGPVWAYGYETPEGWAWAYAYDDAPLHHAPPAIEAHPLPPAYGHGHAHGHHGHHAPPPHYDWRYSEERLFGASYPRLLYLVQTWRRESERVTVHPPRGRGCAGCGGVVVQPVAYPAGHGGFYGGGGFGGGFSGGFGGGFAGGAALSQSAAFARSSQSASFRASQTSQAHAAAGPNQTVIAGTPFPPPAGAPVPPWGPPPMLTGGANAGAYAGAQGFAGR